jgi:hypothetical protein
MGKVACPDFVIPRNTAIKCLRSRRIRSGDAGTGVLTFRGTMTGRLSSSTMVARSWRRTGIPTAGPNGETDDFHPVILGPGAGTTSQGLSVRA